MKKPLQIPVNSIPDTGKDVSLELGDDWFRLWRQEDPGLEFDAGDLTGRVRLEKHGKDILVRGHLEGHLDLTCSRCLDFYAAPYAADFDLLLLPGPEPIAKEEELTAADLDMDFISGEDVDLQGIVREQIILTMPLKPLCREDCRGLCPRCGANLNREACTCKG
jgi:uncharacterized protein